MVPSTPNPRAWRLFFEANEWPALPEGRGLNEGERELIAASLPQFQLGEGARGRSFRRRAAAFAERHGDPEFLLAIGAFIAEEQRHSEQLGLFLDGEGIPRLAADPADSVFRWLRKRAGLRLMVAVLVAGEVVAFPYYRSVRKATGCERLRAICSQILKDEVAHLRFQGFTLRRLGHGFLWRWLHRVAVLVATLAVFVQHRRVALAGGYGLSAWLGETFRALRLMESAALDRVARVGRVNGVIESAG